MANETEPINLFHLAGFLLRSDAAFTSNQRAEKHPSRSARIDAVIMHFHTCLPLVLKLNLLNTIKPTISAYIPEDIPDDSVATMIFPILVSDELTVGIGATFTYKLSRR